MNEITIELSNNTSGYLLYNDGWSKYWKAYVDNVNKPIEIANYNSKAVYLERGLHEVKFVFEPMHYKYALICYLLALLSSFLLIIYFVVPKSFFIVFAKSIQRNRGSVGKQISDRQRK